MLYQMVTTRAAIPNFKSIYGEETLMNCRTFLMNTETEVTKKLDGRLDYIWDGPDEVEADGVRDGLICEVVFCRCPAVFPCNSITGDSPPLPSAGNISSKSSKYKNSSNITYNW